MDDNAPHPCLGRTPPALRLQPRAACGSEPSRI